MALTGLKNPFERNLIQSTSRTCLKSPPMGEMTIFRLPEKLVISDNSFSRSAYVQIKEYFLMFSLSLPPEHPPKAPLKVTQNA